MAQSSYYYELVQLTSSTAETYIFSSAGSTIDLVGCLYRDRFISTSASDNLVTCDEQSEDENRFRFNASLVAGQTYFFVITTVLPDKIGSFAAVITGSGSLTSSPVQGEYLSMVVSKHEG